MFFKLYTNIFFIPRNVLILNIFRKSSLSLLASFNKYGVHALGGGIIAHEVGHNLGMYHDFGPEHGGPAG